MASADGDLSKPFFPTEPSSLRHPKPPRRRSQNLSPESGFWRSFRHSELASGLLLPVTSLAFSPVEPFTLAAASSASIHLYGADSSASDDGDGNFLQPLSHSPISGFSDIAYSPSFRCDGSLLAAGGESGIVQVLRIDKSAPPLRRLRAHSRPVRVVRYPVLADKLHLFSAGDDALLTYWDISSESQLLSFPGAHRDYIRAGCPSPVSPDVIATGSYDQSVKLWDVRVAPEARKPVLSFSHGDPVESVLFLPSGGLLATAGGNVVKLWDVIGGGRLIHTVESHNKSVTDLCIARTGITGESRLLSVSIDGYLKSFDFGAFKITHSMRYPAQLLSVGFSPSGMVRVVGTSNGVIYMGQKNKRKTERNASIGIVSEIDGFVQEPEKPVLRPTNVRYFRRGQNEKPHETDYVIKRPARVKLAVHDKLLKQFRHKEALVAVLSRKNPSSTIAVMEELVARKKLLICVQNLEVDELELLFRFLNRYVTLPQYARFLMGLAKKVLEMRTDDILRSSELKAHVRNIKNVIAEEIKIQHLLQEIQGMISPLLVVTGR